MRSVHSMRGVSLLFSFFGPSHQAGCPAQIPVYACHGPTATVTARPGHGQGHGHGVFILATHPEGLPRRAFLVTALTF